MNKNSSYKYFPSLQFLRGLSVLLVFLFHSNYIFLKNGYQGVYIFFTISGFIIPYIYFNKQYTLKQFYINRFKRIYPLLILVLFTTLIFYFFFGFSVITNRLINSIFFSLIGVSNFYYIFEEVDYFFRNSLFPLAHTWSLSVEILFYLVVPLILILNKKLAAFIFVIYFIIIFSIKYNSFIIADKTYEKLFNNYYAFFQNSLYFIYGTLTFYIYDFIKNKNIKINYIFKEIIGFLGLIIILLNTFGLIATEKYTFIFLNISFGASLFIFSTILEKSMISNIIINKFFLNLGKISYSLFLWHLPVIYFSELYFSDTIFSFLLSISITFLLSFTSYHLIEKKFVHIHLKKLISVKKVIFFSTMSITFVSMYLLKPNNFSLFENFNYLNKKTNVEILNIFKKRVEILNIDKDNFTLHKNTDANKSSIFFSIGDSLRDNYTPALFDMSLVKTLYSLNLPIENINKNIQTQTKIFINCFSTKENLSLNEQIELLNENKEKLDEYKNCFYKYDDYVLDRIINKINLLSKNYNSKNLFISFSLDFDTQVDSVSPIKEFLSSNNINLVKEILNNIILSLDEDIKIYLTLPIPTFSLNSPIPCILTSTNCIKKLDMRNKETSSQIRLYNDLIKIKNVKIIDTKSLFCKNNICSVYSKKNNKIFLIDRHHLSYDGSIKMTQKLENLID